MRLKKQVREWGRKPSGIAAASPVGAEILKGMAKASTAEGRRWVDTARSGSPVRAVSVKVTMVPPVSWRGRCDRDMHAGSVWCGVGKTK